MKVLQISLLALVLAIAMVNAEAPPESCGDPAKALKKLAPLETKMGKAKELLGKAKAKMDGMAKPSKDEPALPEDTEGDTPASRKKRAIEETDAQKTANDDILAKIEKMKTHVKGIRGDQKKMKENMKKVGDRFKGLGGMAEKAAEMLEKGKGLVKGWLESAKTSVKSKLSGAVAGAMGKDDDDEKKETRKKRAVNSALDTEIEKIDDAALKTKVKKLVAGEDGAASRDELMDAIIRVKGIATELLKDSNKAAMEKIEMKGVSNMEEVKSIFDDVDANMPCGKRFALVKAAVRAFNGEAKKAKGEIKAQNEEMKKMRDEKKEELKAMKDKLAAARKKGAAGGGDADAEPDKKEMTDAEKKAAEEAKKAAARKKREAVDNVEGATDDAVATTDELDAAVTEGDSLTSEVSSTLQDTLTSALGGAGSVTAVVGVTVMALVGAMMMA